MAHEAAMTQCVQLEAQTRSVPQTRSLSQWVVAFELPHQNRKEASLPTIFANHAGLLFTGLIGCVVAGTLSAHNRASIFLSNVPFLCCHP